MLELVSPAGFEGYFAAQADALDSGAATDCQFMASLLERYGPGWSPIPYRVCSSATAVLPGTVGRASGSS